MRDLAFALLLSLALIGCGDDDDTATPGASADAATDLADAGADTADASPADAASADAGPTVCTFNSQCPDDERCVDTSGICEPGERGTGRNGLDVCESGNDCESAVCIEGPETGDEFYCSGECETDDDCTGMLPQCLDVAFLGRVCVRESPDA